MLLTIDAGNTRIKAAWWQGASIIRSMIGAASDFVHEPRPQVVVMAVSGDESVAASLKNACAGAQLHIIDGRTPGPLGNKYATPETLGADRWAAATGAWTLSPFHPLLVIDAGTAITYDLVLPEGAYAGGGIAPGVQMRLRALHAETARLPLSQDDEAPAWPGADTRRSLLAGAAGGAILEMQGFIDLFRAQYPQDGCVYLTGGDAPRFEKRLRNPTFAEPNLIHLGLRALALYNGWI